MARDRRANRRPEDIEAAEGFTPASPANAPEPVQAPALEEDEDDEPDGEIDPRDAEIERLRAELATLKAVAPTVKGGRYTVSWKDGPTATIEVRPGERPEDALARYGVHSTPHKIEVREAPADAPLGTHYPGGLKPFLAKTE